MTQQKTKTQLIQELEQAQKRIAELERAAVKKTAAKKTTASTLSKSAGQEWAEKEAFYQTFIDQSHDGIVVLDEQGNITIWNSAQESITGIPSGEVRGQKYWDVQIRLLTPELRARLSLEQIKEALQNTFKTGEYHSLRTLREVEIISADGKRKFIQVSPFSVKTRDGYHVVAISRDITEQRHAANALHENEERFSRVFHVSPSQMAITDSHDGKYIDVNEAFLKTLGFTREEVIGKTASELNLFYDYSQRAALLEKMKEQGYLREENVLVRTKTGELRHGIFSAEYIQVDDHQFLLTVMNDITERKHAEEKLLSSEERHRSLLENMNEAVVEVDEQGRFCYISPNYFNLSGYTPEEELGSSIIAHVHPDDLSTLLYALETYKGLTLPAMTYRIRAKNGEWRWVEASGKSYRLVNGDQRIISVLRDVTRRQLVEEQIKQSEARLKGFLDAAPDAMIIANTEGKIILANLQTENLFGYSQNELLQMEVEQLMPEHMRQIHPAHRAEFTKNPTYVTEGVTREIHTLRKDGNEFPAEISLSQHKMGEDTVVLGSIRDITERKKAEENLRGNQTVLFETQKIAKLQTWVIDFQERTIEVGPGYDQTSEWPEGKYSLEDLVKIIHPLDVDFVNIAWGQASSNNPLDIEFRALLNEELRWVHVMAYNSEFDDGKLRGFAQDVTKRKQAEELAYAQLSLARLVSTVTTDDEALPRCFDVVMEISGTDCGGIYLLDANANVLELAYHKGLGADFIQKVSRYTPDTPSVQMVLAGMMFYFGEADLNGQKHYMDEGLRSIAVIPILDHGHVLGCINIGSHALSYVPEISRQALEIIAPEVGNIIAHLRTEMQLNEAREHLLANEKKLKSLIESQTHYVIRINMEGKYVYWNPQFEKEFGWVHEPDGLKNADSMKTILSHHHQNVIETVQKCISLPGRAFSIEIDKPARDGSTRTTLWEFVCLTDERNQPSEIQCMGVEITDRKISEKALRESEEKYRLLAENISDVIWIMDMETFRFSYVSPSILQLLGYSVDEVMAQDVSASLTPTAAQYMAQVTNERLVEFEQGKIKAYTDEVEQPCKDGTTVWTEATTRFVKNIGTGKLEVYGVSRNITERKKAETAIHLIENRNTALIEHAPDGIAMVDANGVFMFASPSAYRMFGYGAEEIIGRQSREKVHPQDIQVVAGLRDKLLGTPDAPQTIEYRFLHKDGSYHWLESTYTNMFDEPSVNGIVINFRDITDRKLAAEVTRQQGEQLRLLYEASQQLNRTLDVKEIYQTICDFMTIIAPSDTLFISAFDADTQLITCKAYWMENNWMDVSPFPAIPLEEEGKGTQSRVIRSGQSMLLNDYQAFMKTSQHIYYVDDETNEITTEGPDDDEEDVTRSAMIVPLKSGGTVKGVIQVASYHKDAYTEGQLKLLEALSLHIASAEQNALLYTQLLSELNERKQVEEALRASNETAQAILNAATESVFLIETDGTVIAANETTATRLGKQVRSLVGTNIYDSLPPDTAKIRRQRVEALTRDGKPLIFEDERFGAWIENSLYPIFDKSGKVWRIAIYGRDITDRKKMEASLLKSEALLLEAQRIGRIGHMEWNGKDKELICSTELFDILGLPHDAVLTQETIGQMMVTEDISTLQQEDKTSFQSHKDLNYQYRIHIADGSERWLHQIGKVTYGENGAPIRMMAIIQDITERKQIENALRDSEARARAMLQAIPDLMFRMDRQGVFLDYKADANQLYAGASDLPLIGKRNRNISPADFSDLIEKEIEKTLETGTLQAFEYKLEVPQAGVRDYEARMTPSGKDEVLSIVRDITEQNKAKTALRASEEKYRVLIESLDNVVVSMDEQGKILYINDLAAMQLGGIAEEIIGKTMYELFPEEVAHTQMSQIQQVIREDKGHVFESVSMIQGVPRWYRTSMQPIHDEEGRVNQVLVNSTDIHDLKTTQQELQDLNRTLEERVEQRTAEVQDLYDNAPAGYHSLDPNGCIILVNETELKWMGYTREEMIGQPIQKFLTPASLNIFRENFPAFKQRGWLKDLELEYIRKNGTILPALINATAIHDEHGNFILSRSTVMDNTEHKAVDEALRNANLEMARAMRMKDEFLASMSHELRTPLNGILGLSEALQLDVYGTMTDKQKSTLVHIENSGRHLLELINDILDVSKIEAGKFELEMALCSLGDICQSSIQLTKGMAGKKQQNVNFNMNPASINIKADGRRLKQVLVNLLSNAVKFTPENGSLGMEVTKDEVNQIVYISVWDKGIGISSEDIKKLFQPFVQLDSSLSRQQTGTGLGLTLVQRLVEMHGGSIEIQSTPGEGSRFIVALPSLSVDSITDAIENTYLSKFRFALIIEDEAMDAGHLARYCKALQITPILHSTGKGAIERVLATRPNVIFLDIQLPDISGWDVLTQLKTHPETRHIPVVITSMDDEKQKAAQLKADGYLVKFFTISDMRTILTNLQKAPVPVETTDTPSGKPIATVMIVDDNEVNIETVIDYLGSKSFNVAAAHSGVDFLARAPQIRPDIILMDIQMPEMDGLETIRRLRALKDDQLASVPIIALTALAMPGDRELCIEAGADEYVTKPFRLKELFELITQMLDDKKRTEQ